MTYFLSYLLFFLGLIFMCSLAYFGDVVEFYLQWFFAFSLFPLLFYGVFNIFKEYGGRGFKLSLSRRRAAVLIGLAIVMLILIFLCIPNAVQDMFGVTNAGDVVHSRSWFELNGKYFEVVNGGAAFEIEKEEYDRLELQLARIFSMFIVVFSYVSIVMFTVLKFRNRSLCDGVK
ncbi:hypothetical protein ACFOLJ_06425 [Rugamonas sp. CCM 8940]|uniref:hypothetical protein n=1 Tax=Rugamonas sp. CCM 8940 TaxID=2765359 RepID=UPI0018F6A156|nr:hypothetical protein [Rugamonas sp. CCM 8940]MBJ7310410.1 hypothetical protein [Rugamonas sp. CCM 8940]